MLGLGNGLVTGGTPSWTPSNESSLVAWYQKGAKVTYTVSNKVSLWTNEEGTTDYDMVQGTATNQPTYDGSTSAVNFDGVDNFLQMTGQITLPTTFTIGIKFNVDTTNTVLLADDDQNNEMVKIMDADTIRVKAYEALESPTSVTANLNLSAGSFDADSYVVITRDGSGNMSFWHKGVDQSTSATLSVDYGVDIDTMGRRQGATPNYFDGDIFDVIIFNETNSTLTELTNLYLAGL